MLKKNCFTCVYFYLHKLCKIFYLHVQNILKSVFSSSWWDSAPYLYFVVFKFKDLNSELTKLLIFSTCKNIHERIKGCKIWKIKKLKTRIFKSTMSKKIIFVWRILVKIILFCYFCVNIRILQHAKLILYITVCLFTFFLAFLTFSWNNFQTKF